MSKNLKQVKKIAVTLFKIFSIIFMLVTTAGILKGYYFFLWDLPVSTNRPYDFYRERAPKVYQKAGFPGTVSNFEHGISLHKSVMLYDYTEKIAGETIRYPVEVYLNSLEEKEIPEYTLTDIVDMYMGFKEEHLNDGALFAPFFSEALVNNPRLQVFREDLIKTLELQDLEDVQITFSYDDENRGTINREMKKDLAAAMKTGGSPLSAIRQLDPFKYVKLGYIRVRIAADFQEKTFEDYFESIDKRYFKPGYYEIFSRDEASTVVYFVNDKLEWE